MPMLKVQVPPVKHPPALQIVSLEPWEKLFPHESEYNAKEKYAIDPSNWQEICRQETPSAIVSTTYSSRGPGDRDLFTSPGMANSCYLYHWTSLM